MKKYLIIGAVLVAILYFTGLFEAFVLLFKKEDGHTNWQHLANWSAGTFIIVLSVISTFLYFSRQAANKANTELEEIKRDLELRVQERTATLDEANRLLKQEISEHLETTKRLYSSEQYIKSILSSMPSMLVGLDAEGRITQWNKKAEEYTGLAAADALDKNLWDAYPTITVTGQQVTDALENNQVLTFRHSQRGLFHFDITVYPLEGTTEPGVVLIIDDMTQQVKSENRIIQRERMSNMGELASTMAHDIDIPLQAMLKDLHDVHYELMRKQEQVDTQLMMALNDALNKGEQATAVVNNLLEFASSQQQSKQPVLMTDIIDHCIELAGRILALPGGLSFEQVEIERQYDQGLPKVCCHYAEMQQVFLRLLRHCLYALNRVEHQAFQPKIQIRAVECYDALWLKISHNGVGLTMEEQQSIFEPFFSSDSTEDNDDANKRLSFSYFIVTEHHHGQLAVTSDPDVGTTFHMQFELLKACS
mgnify:CR=1 FL=1|tara:strand:- start:6231 stop:7664 length:1434 start_codon:yes stop_codon:yes gene_type:complete